MRRLFLARARFLTRRMKKLEAHLARESVLPRFYAIYSSEVYIRITGFQFLR